MSVPNDRIPWTGAAISFRYSMTMPCRGSVVCISCTSSMLCPYQYGTLEVMPTLIG